MSRKTVYLLIATFIFAVIGYSIWVYFQTHKVTQRNFDRIQIGMTEDQVEDLLGGSKKGTIMVPKIGACYPRLYADPGCRIIVYFNPTGEVEDMYFEESQTEGWLPWLKALLDL